MLIHCLDGSRLPKPPSSSVTGGRPDVEREGVGYSGGRYCRWGASILGIVERGEQPRAESSRQMP
jgi:hypothetical protein